MFRFICVVLLIAIPFGGCSRLHYRNRADSDAYTVLDEKTHCWPWYLPGNFSIEPSANSRLNTGDCIDDPLLPDPSPRLYEFEILDLPDSNLASEEGDPLQIPAEDETAAEEVVISAIPPSAWDDIPLDCRRRMFDFDSLRKEAELSENEYGVDVVIQTDDSGARLTLKDIVDLALANSREYQSQKENLYRVALRLSLERFDYELRPTPNGLNTAANYSHNRNGGTTINTLGIPTTASAQRILVTGGDIFARFANQVLLTFNGPSGFSANVGSDLLFEFSQPLIQRDVVFESLTQAERNVVYAARDFARFRKEFFVDFASQYYSLIRSFRQVEIDSQNYFSLVRAFNQAEAEYRAGLVPRFQVDQVEQNLLSGRGGLIGTCNGLEQSLDSLKINMGLPTEIALNIDLTELNQLTRRDQLSVAGDLVDRVRRRLSSAQREPDRIELLSTGVVLVDRVLDANDILLELEMPSLDVRPFRLARSRMLVDSARLTAQEIRTGLENEINSESPSAPVIFQRTLALTNELLVLANNQLELAALLELDQNQIEAFQRSIIRFRTQTNGLRDDLSQMIRDEQLLLLPDLVRSASQLGEQVQALVTAIDQFNGEPVEPQPADQQLDKTVTEMTQLLANAEEILSATGGGLTPIEIDMDDAMMTALVLRFDLMNQRGFLADDWRQIKLAADELRSILNFSASQEIRTRSDVNRVTDFTFDESRTALSLRFDAPVNRIAQRNAYRNSLIDYQASLRSLAQLEDTIKFSVRNDLRNLDLDREQYDIAVASAALAFERVVSTSLEFRLGTGGVSARDFLEAQTAYTDALSAVASRHIDYILDRTQLFLDLELLSVEDDGFWHELYNEEYQPEPHYQLPPWAAPAYGNLPCVRYSDDIKRMLCVPAGHPVDEQIWTEETVPVPAVQNQ